MASLGGLLPPGFSLYGFAFHEMQSNGPYFAVALFPRLGIV